MSVRSKTLEIAISGLTAVALIVAGCSNNNDSGSTPPTSPSTSMPSMSGMPGMPGTATTPTSPAAYNDADVMFLQMMYPHHAQAVEMADLVPSRSQNQQVLDLAVRIKNAQAPEMAQISSLLQSFGKPAPTADSGTMSHGTPGMMNPEQLSSLKALSGKEFDTMWLNMMIDHHTGAIDMGKTEQTSGTNTDAKNLADTIVSAQQGEIDQMKAMLEQN
ncbi:DUF305 domain-containing protein [Nocardia sp. NBC_00403]|uniref:DUF305 domain-containing protein n=1 Tax=Nocardia sp. NBC_00403 TaxID=2975990 RepID=UPI002E24A39D